jgi:hypothetical protein
MGLLSSALLAARECVGVMLDDRRLEMRVVIERLRGLLRGAGIDA